MGALHLANIMPASCWASATRSHRTHQLETEDADAPKTHIEVALTETTSTGSSVLSGLF